MDVAGEDHREGLRGRAPSAQPGSGRASPAARTQIRLELPADWPEVIMFRAGYRLAGGDADEVPTLIRQGIPIDAYLSPDELGAMMALPELVWSRWLMRGWWTWQVDHEGG